MGRKPKDVPQDSLLEAKTNTAPCVPAIRAKVKEWRERNYPDVTPTTRTLLNYWFKSDHRKPTGERFVYHDAQRDAIESLIYVFEVAKKRRFKALVESYAPNLAELRLLQNDEFARYCVKMATGSGKTKVMALAIAWQYFNAVCEGKSEYAKTSILIAPNVIVFERLKNDFANGAIFRTDPIIPDELRIFWEMECYVRGDTERAWSEGALYLTNVQQLHNRARVESDEPDAIAALLGPKPPAAKVEVEGFTDRILARKEPILVLNDEAHHTHDEKLKWNELIRELHLNSSNGLAAQLDFTATPKHSKGALLFAWTIFDYPLKQAIIDGIVKRPLKGVAAKLEEQKSDVPSVRYQAYLTAGVNRWREYREALAPSNKKPVLFAMLNSTAEAEDVGDYLRRTYPTEFAGDKLLIIHTDTAGEVSKRDLDKARATARTVDEQASPVNAIVSVLMLREGWDVANVTVVVGLRPYSSKAEILPEQTIGRGLRLMFRGEIGPSYKERVDVIGNKGFISFVDKLAQDEEMDIQEFDLEKDRLEIVTIIPDANKLDKDIAMPELSPILERKKSLAEEIRALVIPPLAVPLPIKLTDEQAKSFTFEGYDIISLEREFAKEYDFPEPQTAGEVIGYYAKRIANDVKLPSQFSELAPKVKDFLENKAFGKRVDLETPEMVRAIGSNVATHVTITTFVRALRSLVVQELTPKLISAGRPLSETPSFPFGRKPIEAKKTVFNFLAASNNFEDAFGRFLEGAHDVDAFAKIPKRFGFTIDYTDNAANLRYYEPDFVAKLTSGVHVIIETKGQEDVDVKHKDRAATIWAENATLLTGTEWRFLKVPQKAFEQLEPTEFNDIWYI